MTSTNELAGRPKLDVLFATARRHESALELALLVGDDIVGIVAAARLRQTLLLVESTLAAQGSAVTAMVRTATEGMQELLQRAPVAAADQGTQKFIRWAIAMGRSAPSFKGPHIFELDVAGVDLPAFRFLGLHLERCRFNSSLTRASLVDSLVESSDFSGANLQDTLWQRTHVQRSCFGGASFLDATFDCAMFVDCDLRGVDFSMVHHDGLLGIADVRFVRCDLRQSNWDGRDLSAARFLDCKLHDLRLADDLGHLNVTRGDVSAMGDGSRMIGADTPEPRSMKRAIAVEQGPYLSGASFVDCTGS